MKNIRVFLLAVIISISAASFPCSVIAETCVQWVAKVVSLQGNVQARRSGETQWKPVKFRDTYCPGDRIRTLDKSRADIMINETILRLDQDTTITFVGPEKERTFMIELLKGASYFFSRFRRSLKVTTPFVNASVEGTEFLVKVDEDQTFISLFEGQVLAENDSGKLLINGGESAIARKGEAPELKVVVKPRDAVQWTLYYPPALDCKPPDFREKAGDPRSCVCNASLLLSVGRVDEAKADIEKALKLSPGYSEALSLQSIIAVAQNEKEKALNLAKKAVEADPKSASAYVALSYAQQSNFDLKEALNSLKEAVKAEPENALAWARLSELYQSFGELDESLKAANKAAEMNPDISRTQTVLGFAYLTEVRIKESKAAFQRAIELDQADPLPRLGLGLALIRDGNLDEGRSEIEIAASLDPNNSLIRSYLGKAFYEEKREKKAEDQYKMAEQLDPKDPTPYFYDAIKKQTGNRSVEALQDMQKAIELNDDRAVYRSRLLLDADLAARSASLARIYTDLGFQQLALVEGWKSVNTDPADFSGHRFLADSYSALPRHEIARVSELLQSQLLQPININPVQPHLAESNLFILEGAGPSDLSFNEFNPLFSRNRYALQLSGVAGSNSTFGDEVVVSVLKDKVSLSAGQFHYETDGWRENNDLKQDIYNVFAQYSLSPQTSVQAELRYRDSKEGDLRLFFNPEDVNKDERFKEFYRTARLGMHHSFSPNSDFIASVIYQNADFDNDKFFGPGTDFKIGRNSVLTEAQHLYRADWFKIVGGAGYFYQDHKTHQIFFEQSSTEKTTPHMTNLYTYAQINLIKDVTLTVGGSADFSEFDVVGEKVDREEFNPKFGLIWKILPNTTIRLAAFRTLQRMLVTDQTIEPTQVAGFNQFFDDTEGTKAWRYGMGVDHKFFTQLYGGAEFSRRDLEVPGAVFDPETGSPKLIEGDWQEQLGLAYIYWTPYPWLSLSTGYQYECFKRPQEFAAGNISRLNTHRLIFGIGFFHPSGFIAQLKPAYISQDGKFVEALSPFETRLVPKEDQFWVVDASIGYRLPKRFGLFTVVVKNLLNNEFKFQDTDPGNPRIQPKRFILAKLTLSF